MNLVLRKKNIKKSLKMSLRKRPNANRSSFNQGENRRVRAHKRKRPNSIPLHDLEGPSKVMRSSLFADGNDEEGDCDIEEGVASMPFSPTLVFGELSRSDSFQHEVAAKTQQLFIGKQEAELEVYIDRIVRNEGDNDKALLHVVSNIDSEVKVQLLVNSLIHRGANPSCTDKQRRTPLHYAAEKGFRGVCFKLLENDAWPSSRDKEDKMPFSFAYEQGNDNVASLLICYMPNEDVRSMYACSGNKPSEFKFHELLRRDMQKTVLAVLDSMLDQHQSTNHYRVYYNILEADENGRPPTHEEFDKTNKSSLQVIAKSGNKNIIYHDVVRLLIRRKWKKYARFRFQINALVYMLSLVAMTFSAVVAAMADDPMTFDTPLQVGRAVCEIFSVVVCFWTLISELNQLRKHRLEYFMDPLNWADFSSSLLLLSVVVLRLTHRVEQWPVFSVGFVLWTSRITKYAAVFRQTGAYSQILYRIVVHDFLQFMTVFVVILVAFSGAFILSLRGEGSLKDNPEINSFWKVLFLGVRILIEAERIIEYTELSAMSCVLMVLFLFTCCVVLLNILIAQLSDTYQHVQHDAQRGLEVNRAWIVARVELNSVHIGKEYRTSFYKEYEDIGDIQNMLERWESPPLNVMNKNIQDIWESLDSHKLNLLTVHNRLARQEKSLQTIQTQLQVILKALQPAERKTNEIVSPEDVTPMFFSGNETDAEKS